MKSSILHMPPLWGAHPPHERTRRHRHEEGHLVLVLEGCYSEAGDTGRHRVVPGDVLVQRPFQAHANAMGGKPVRLLSLPLIGRTPPTDAGSIIDPDEIVRLAANSVQDAVAAVVSGLRAKAQETSDWPDQLAAALRTDANFRLSAWAGEMGLAPETVSRGFLLAFGVSPKRYRADIRAANAWRQVVQTRETLSMVATTSGFADQAHMTREIRLVTGLPPGRWREAASSSFKT